MNRIARAAVPAALVTLIARRTRVFIAESRSMPGTIPTVEIV